ncbi:hypothetical protein DNU06_17245 [Putridiphycobacter roseus]|uniref:Uncharacterized protein n=1 Tax=Putridiphycobacter roseus TaxID=2219161 RepID=A0A2W1NBV9_9FLAO|nr:hypothetical protein [Putridiphycobacter roseus]PZE15596.1 hypothetical protein DNU06_17245 [Putridiphycobacter roseus]
MASEDIKKDALELIRAYLPKYLTPELSQNLFSIVSEHFPLSSDGKLIYCNNLESEFYYQGDAIVDIPFSVFANGEYKTNYLKGVIMSNTCDIASENDRIENSFVQFSSIFSLEEYISKLNEKKISENKIDSFLSNLKGNRISNLFYLPKIDKVMDESFIRFDVNVSLPISIFEGETYDKDYKSNGGDRLFSFSNYGFYLFLIKLSVHYCRFREGVFRNA